MQNNWFKYPTLFFLLIIYLNRGLFISSLDTEVTTAVKGEMNSVIELLFSLINGRENTIDEDGDSPETYNHAKTIQPQINHFYSLSTELKQSITVIHKIQFPFKETILPMPIYGTIDHPPEQV